MTEAEQLDMWYEQWCDGTLSEAERVQFLQALRSDDHCRPACRDGPSAIYVCGPAQDMRLHGNMCVVPVRKVINGRPGSRLEVN